MGITGNGVKDDVIVLGGRELRRAKNGLDEAQVASFIEELIRERDRLAQSQAHITSLSRLAERAVVEADKLATQIKAEAAEQAKTESAAIVDKAKEQGRRMAEEKIAEAVAIANEKGDAIKAKAEEEAALLLENQKNRIRNELRNLVNQQFGYLVEEMERLKQQAAAIQANFDSESLEPREEKDTVKARIAGESSASAMPIAKGSNMIVAEESGRTPGQRLEQSSDRDNTEYAFELSKLLRIEEKAALGESQWEVRILPPFDISQIMAVVAYLDQLPEVINTEIIVPQIEMPAILVFLRKPMAFVDVLQAIPGVAYVEAVTADNVGTNGEPNVVRIGLSGNTTAQER